MEAGGKKKKKDILSFLPFLVQHLDILKKALRQVLETVAEFVCH